MNNKEALKLAILEYEKDLEFDENNQWVKNVLNGLAIGDKFSFKGGVLFAHQKDGKTYVKLSSQKSVITKL